MNISPQQYIKSLKNLFSQNGDAIVAEGQMNYMRNKFSFYGLKVPQRKPLEKEIFKKYGLPNKDEIKEVVKLCFEAEHREMQFFAVDLLKNVIKQQDKDFIIFLEEIITTKSWWDTVDSIAKVVGIHFLNYPELIKPVTEKWISSNNIWLQRISIIFQLHYKEKTDSDLLFDYIRRLSGSKEFFIRKGAGWALRQYSKTNPTAVLDFIENAVLSPLTKREGLKWIERK